MHENHDFARRARFCIAAITLLACSFQPLTRAEATKCSPDSLHVAMRGSFLPSIPLLVRVELRDGSAVCRDVWDLEATIDIDGEGLSVVPAEPTVQLRNGVGSVLVRVEATSNIDVTVRAGEFETRKRVDLLTTEGLTVAPAELPAGLTEWSGVVHVPDDLLVPSGSTLRVRADTLVLLGSVSSGTDGADINIEGRIETQGSATHPVTFTAAGDDDPFAGEEGREWGELHHNEADESVYNNTIITLAGNSPRGGHTGTGPAIRPDDSTILFQSCSITDTAGKSMEADGSDITMRDCLLSRSVMGPEVDGTQMILERTYIFEMFGDDDNDGIYLHDQRDGQIIRLRDCTVGAGDDDAIDTLGSDVTIEGCIVRDFADKGISVFHDTALVRRCLIVGNDIGISCKTGNNRESIVTVENTTIAGNRIGIEARNKGGDDDDALIYYRVRDSIIRRGSDADTMTVRTDYEHSFIELNYSNLTELPEDWGGIGNEGNSFADPRFIDVSTKDFHLLADSPCIDAGDPESPADVDGSRTDMGAFPFLGEPVTLFDRGDANGDGATDISDGVTILLFLFGGHNDILPCDDAADVDDTGDLTLTDAVVLLNYLLQGGTPPSAPIGDCGTDPTDDALDCADSC